MKLSSCNTLPLGLPQRCEELATRTSRQTRPVRVSAAAALPGGGSGYAKIRRGKFVVVVNPALCWVNPALRWVNPALRWGKPSGSETKTSYSSSEVLMATEEKRDEIEELVRQACEVPAPDDEFVRTLAAQARVELLSTLPQGSDGELPRPRVTLAARTWRRAAIAAAALAAAVLAGLLLWPRQEAVAWAEVAKAVRAMPWTHAKMVGGGESWETWLSFSPNISALHGGDTIRYDDFQSGVRYDYDLTRKKLYRSSVDHHSKKELVSLEGVFEAIFRGDAIPADALGPI